MPSTSARLDLDRLAALLALASDPAAHPGETCNAMAACRRMLDRAGMCWRDVLAIPSPAASTPSPPPPDPEPGDDLAEVRALAARVLAEAPPGSITPWEASFAASLTTWRGRITDRQRAILDRLARKAGLAPRRAA